MANKINITDNKPFFLDDKNLSYVIEEGKANVFIAEFEKNVSKYRLFLREVNKGDVVCGLNSVEGSTTYKLLLINSTRSISGEITNLNISTKKATEKDQGNFVSKINKYIHDVKYDTGLVQHYQLNQAKDWRNIFTSFSSTQMAQDTIIHKITDAFGGRDPLNVKTLNTTEVYFAFEKVARATKIKPVKFASIDLEERQGLDIEKLSALSNCVCRKIMLDVNWWKKDNGSLVAFYGEEKEPVACIYKRGRYVMYKNDSDVSYPVTEKVASSLHDYAYNLYRAFPQGQLDYKDIIRFIKRSISAGSIVNAIFISLFITLLGMLTPTLNQFIYDRLIPADDYIGIYGACTVLISIIIGSGCFSLVNGFLNLSIFSKLKYSLQIAFFDRIFKLKQSFISQYEPADLSMRILGISDIFTKITTKTAAGVLTFVFSIFYLFQMYRFMPSLVGAAIFLTLIMFLILMVSARVQYRWYKKGIQINIDKSSLLFQLIRGIQKLRVAGAEDRAINKYIDLHLKNTELSYKTGFYWTFISILATFFSLITSMIFFTIIFNNGLVASVGNIMGFFTSFGIFSAALYKLPDCYLYYLQAKPWFERLTPILKEEPERNNSTKAIEDVTGNIEVRHLSFAYNEDSHIVLDDISFSINAGEYVAIVGPSGCGKSTLLNLLLGFNRQDKGKIYYDNRDLDDIDKKSLRKNFGVVLQDGDLIAGSILDNILISNPDATLDDVDEVLKKVDLFDEVQQMPMGVNTLLSEGSGLISGGQKQRILIARAIIGKPKILFFDEATSALDNITQAHIVESLNKIGGTRVVIAHRLSTIINCDRIIVLNEGKIAEMGTYEELMNNKNLFYDLVQRQIA